MKCTNFCFFFFFYGVRHLTGSCFFLLFEVFVLLIFKALQKGDDRVFSYKQRFFFLLDRDALTQKWTDSLSFDIFLPGLLLSPACSNVLPGKNFQHIPISSALNMESVDKVFALITLCRVFLNCSTLDDNFSLGSYSISRPNLFLNLFIQPSLDSSQGIR